MRRVVVPAVFLALAGIGATATATTPSISGRGHGHWHYLASDPTIADAPRTEALHGHGRFGGSAATIAGHVIGLGFIARGRCTVKLKLTTASGSVVVRGTSLKRYAGFSQCGNDFGFRYHTRKPTGGYADESFKGRGHIRMKTRQQTASHTRRFVVRLS